MSDEKNHCVGHFSSNGEPWVKDSPVMQKMVFDQSKVAALLDEKDEIIKRLTEERDALQCKLDNRHMDLEIVVAYDSGRWVGEKERDELAAQVVALMELIDGMECGRIENDGCFVRIPEGQYVQARYAIDDIHPAATRCMRELDALRKLEAACARIIPELDEVTESGDGRYGHFVGRATGESIAEAWEAVEAAKDE